MAVCAVFAAVLWRRRGYADGGSSLAVSSRYAYKRCVDRAQVTVGKLLCCICDAGHVWRKSQLGMRARIPIMALLFRIVDARPLTLRMTLS
jgi:hypothetical protein